MPVYSIWGKVETGMPNNDVGDRHRLYTECRDDLLNRQLSNSEHFDKSVLSLSSALLGASIAFIRPSGPDALTHHVELLAWSWIALAVAVGTTMLSFMVSQKAVDRQLALADMVTT